MFHQQLYQELALDTLKRKGLRITQPRRLVIELLDQSKIPLSAYEIKAHLDAAGEKVDTVSVYRIVECLEENGLIHRVLSSGKVQKCQLESEEHCQHAHNDHCHHLLVCQGCGQAAEVHCPGLNTLIELLEIQANFQIRQHHLEFVGYCSDCQQKTKAFIV